MGPLHGIRIVDLTTVVMGPVATGLLGDLGGDVIKVESPDGDVLRRVGPSRSGEMGGLFLHSNRSKRSIALDLKSPQGRAIILQLIASADVFVHNLRPAALARLGLSHAELCAVKPDIISVETLGYGRGGRYAGQAAYDDLIQGLVGLPALMAGSGQEMRFVPVNIADRMVGLYAATAVLAALLHRNATGEGQQVEVPMFETMASVVLGDHMGGRSFAPPLDAGGYARLLAPSRRPYTTADGHLGLLLYTQVHRDRFAQLIAELEGGAATIPALAEDMHRLALRVLPERPTAAWRDLLAARDIPHQPVHDIAGLMADPHLADVGFFQPQEHPSEGPVVTMRPPWHWSASPPEPQRPAPRLGEHGREVLAELGLDPAEIDAAIAAGVVHVPAQA